MFSANLLKLEKADEGQITEVLCAEPVELSDPRFTDPGVIELESEKFTVSLTKISKESGLCALSVTVFDRDSERGVNLRGINLKLNGKAGESSAFGAMMYSELPDKVAVRFATG